MALSYWGLPCGAVCQVQDEQLIVLVLAVSHRRHIYQ